MTYKEIYDNLAADSEKINIKKNYLLPKAIREFKKETVFPAWRWYEYKIPATMNTYIIFFYVESRNFIDKPECDCFCVHFEDKKRFVIKVDAIGYKQEGNPLSLIRLIRVYTSHFFDRYNERLLKDNSIGSTDVACRYFSRNKKEIPIEINEEINKNLKKHGESANYGSKIRDGFCFMRSAVQNVSNRGGDKNDRLEAVMFMYTTFMNEAGMEVSQLSAIGRKVNDEWSRCIKLLQEEASNGEIELTLGT